MVEALVCGLTSNLSPPCAIQQGLGPPWLQSHGSGSRSGVSAHQLEGLQQALGTLKPMATRCCRHVGVQCNNPPPPAL